MSAACQTCAKSNTSANGVSRDGLVYVDMGLCTASGAKSKIKTDMTHRHLRIETPKDLRARGLNPAVWKDAYVLPQHLKVFYEALPS